MRYALTLILFSCFVQTAQAEQTKTPLPEPLTFEYALKHADDMTHPDLMLATSDLELAIANLQNAESNTDFQAQLELKASVIEPSSLATNQDKDDHSAKLRLTKPLYDFGQSENKIEAAVENKQATEKHIDFLKSLRRIEIAKHFFEVLLADLKFSWNDEDMAIAYVRFSNAQELRALNKLSDVEVFDFENRYQQSRNRRFNSEAEQRNSRAMLAEVLNRPGELSSNLLMPELNYHEKVLGEYSDLLDKMLLNNPQLIFQKVKVDSSQKELQAARLQNRPQIDAEFEVAEYARDTASREDWRASINLTVPLLEHAGLKAEISKSRSKWIKQRAELNALKSRLRQQLLVLWQKIRLLKAQREQAMVTLELRELELDKSRALYEMEVKTNLGDSMTAISEAKYYKAKVDFDLVLAWMELEVLLGKTNDGELQ